MKTTKHVLAICIGMMMISFANAQDWQTNSNTISGSEWFGATSSSIIELDIEHQAEDLPIIARLILVLPVQYPDAQSQTALFINNFLYTHIVCAPC